MSEMAERTRVLHIDDDAEFADLTAEMLEQNHDRFIVETFTSASEGLDRLADREFDCVVSDYEMPEQDGIELLETIREMRPDLPFLLFTGKGSEQVAGEALRKGATDYLQKRGGTEQYNLLANRIRNAVQRYETDRSRRQWKRAIETATEGIAIVSEDGEFYQINDSYAAAYNESPAALVGTNWREWYPDEEIDRFENEILPTLRDEGAWEGESVGHRTDGAEFTQYLSLSMLDDGGHVCVMRDITEQKEREQQLKETTLKLESLVEAFPDVAFIKDVEGNYLEAFAGPETESLLYEGPEAYEDGQHVTDVFDGDEADRVLATIQRAVDTDTIQSLEYKLDVPSGTRWFESRVAPIDGTIQGREAVVWVARDITDRKEHEQLLRQEQQRFQILFEQLTQPLVEVEYDGLDPIVRDVNPAFEEAFGYDASTVIGESLDAYIVPDDRQDEAEEINTHVRQGGRLISREVTRQTVNGLREFLLENAVYDDGSGGFAIYTDITERKRQRERYEAFIEQSTDIITVLSPDGIYQYQSPSCKRILGYDPSELLGESAFEYIHPEDRDRVVEMFTEAISSPEMTPTAEYRFKHKDGTWRWIESIGNNQLDNPAIEGFIVNSRDITQRKEREQELQATRERMEFALEATDTLVWDWNVESNQATFYPSEESLYGTTVTTREDFMDVIHPEDREQVRESLTKALETGEPKHEEVRIRRNGEIRWIEAPGKPVTEDGTTHMIGVVRDITDRKEQEQTLQRQNERLERFVSVVSHDIRNPMNVVQARVELAQEECDSTHLAKAADALNRMETLIEDLLTLAREGQQVGDTRPVALATISEECWGNVMTDTASLVIDTEQMIRADPSRLQELLANLIRNAIEHGDTDVTVTIGDLEDGFYVADDGPGIPDEDSPAVFESGYSTADEGTGLGLTIVEEIVEAHGWEIQVTEGDAGGARFEITQVDVIDK